MSRTPIAFISYSHGTSEENARVLDLADYLRRNGVACEVDRYEEAPSGGWPEWITNQIVTSEFVLVVCNEDYLRKSQRQVPEGTGKGVKFESSILLKLMYDAEGKNTKSIPIVFDVGDVEFQPVFVRGATWYNVATDDGRSHLVRRLFGKPAIARPPLGRPPPELLADEEVAIDDIPELRVTEGFIQLFNRQYLDAEFRGATFSIESHGIELGRVGPQESCTPCMPTRPIDVSLYVVGSSLGRGNARIVGNTHADLSYAGHLTVFGRPLEVQTEYEQTLTSECALTGLINGYRAPALTASSDDRAFGARLHGRATAEVTIAGFDDPEHGLLFNLVNCRYTFLNR
jgi:hypothetical protein